MQYGVTSAKHLAGTHAAAVAACDRARECAVLWFAEVQRRCLHREFGDASLELYATQGLGFSLNRYWQFKRLANDLERLPALREAVVAGELGWTKAQQVARVATPQTQAAWVARAAVAGRRELAGEVRAAREGARRMAAAVAGRLEDGRLFGEAAAADVPIAVAPVQIVVQRCPECAAAAVATSRGELRLAPAQVAQVDGRRFGGSPAHRPGTYQRRWCAARLSVPSPAGTGPSSPIRLQRRPWLPPGRLCRRKPGPGEGAGVPRLPAQSAAAQVPRRVPPARFVF